jgi:hypothetical protein
MSKCSSCGSEIIWAKTENGKAMPLDAAPVDPTKVDGTCLLIDGVARFGAIDAPTREPRYVSHFATCPNAAKHRRKRQ